MVCSHVENGQNAVNGGCRFNVDAEQTEVGCRKMTVEATRQSIKERKRSEEHYSEYVNT